MVNQLLESQIVKLVDSETFNSIGSISGVESGFATMNGKTVCVFAVSGGIGITQGKLISKAIKLAASSGVPIVGIWDSSGALVEDGIGIFEGYGLILEQLTQASGVIPRIMLMVGKAIGSGALIPPLMDFTVSIRGKTTSYVSPPETIRLCSGEVFDVASMANADVMEQVLATTHIVSENEQEAMSVIRKVVEYLPSNNLESNVHSTMESPSKNPVNTACDMSEVIMGIVDYGSFFPIQSNFGRGMIVGFARISGQAVGVIANQPSVNGGCLDTDGLLKATRFAKVFNAFNLPIITVVNSQGFLPDVNQELAGIARQSAKFIQVYSEATVPKVALITGKAYGGAFLSLANRWIGTDLVYTWPNAEISPTNIEAMIQLMYNNQFFNVENPIEERKEMTKKHREQFTSPQEALRLGYIDQIIEPNNTAVSISNGLFLLRGKRINSLGKKNSVIPI